MIDTPSERPCEASMLVMIFGRSEQIRGVYYSMTWLYRYYSK